MRGTRPQGARERSNSMERSISQRLAALLSVKSLVTLTLTAVFAALTLRGGGSREFSQVYATVIAFYFGTQARREAQGEGGQ